ncbi:MAG: hypothetical protein ABH879_06810 [archaeon]
MERFQEARDSAIKYVRLADHVLTQTYPLVKDPKLLLAVLDNIKNGLINAMDTILYYERLFKRIPPFGDTFESRYGVFKGIVEKYKMNPDYVKTIREVKETIAEHRKSPVEFARQGKFIICSDNYQIKTISTDRIKQHLAVAKDLAAKASQMVSKNEHLFA